MSMRHTLETVRLAVDMPAILAYAEITADFNPIHVDPEFAATTPMGGVIAHGTMSSNLILQSVAASFGRRVAQRCAMDIRFARPVRVGDVLEAGGIATDRPGVYEVRVRNQDGVAVIEGTVTVAPEG